MKPKVGQKLRNLRRRHRNRRRKLQKQRRPINVIASILTTFSLYCGIASVFASINLQFEHAAYWILGAMIFDTVDGAVARMTRTVSDFGKELDSISDVVSFGVAPSVLVYLAYIREQMATGTFMANTGSTIAIVYVICGALRLARYNVFQSERRDYFVGLPIPAAAGVIASFTLFTHYFELQVAYWVFGPLTLLLAALMVSTVLYPKDKLKRFLLAPRHAFQVLALCGIAIAVFHYAIQYSPAIVLLPLGLAYVLYGVTTTAVFRVRRLFRGRAGVPAEDQGHSAHGPHDVHAAK